MLKKFTLILLFLLNCFFISVQAQDSLKKFVDIDGTERGIFYHISSADGPSGKNNHILCWYTHKEVPKTHFVIEQLCWNKWIKQAELFAGKGTPGVGEYAGKIKGKFLYKYKIPSHSGENGLRVLLLNDSNVCLGVSKELLWTSQWSPKVEYNIKKKDKAIVFSSETYFELYDSSGVLAIKGRGLRISYGMFEKGTYTLNYDNTTTTIDLK